MERPSRKRKRPTRFSQEEIETSNEITGRETEPLLIVQEEEEDRIPKRKRTVKQNIKGKGKQRSETGSLFRMMRHTMMTLSAKVNTISKEIREIKMQKSNETNLVAPTVSETDNIEEIQKKITDQEFSEETVKTTGKIMEKEIPLGEYKKVIYNVKNMNIEKPKFGENTEIQPVTFLEDLETYLRKASREGKELELIQECLVGDARDWARIYKSRWTTVEDFKTDFLSTFWGDKEQNELRRNIAQGIWDRTQTPMMLNHFLRLIGKSQMLTYKIPEKQLIADIIRHYPKYIQQGWFTSKIGTIIETAEFLRNMDDIGKQERQIPNTNGSSKEKDKKTKEIQNKYQRWQRPTVGQYQPNYRQPIGVNTVEATTGEQDNSMDLN